MASQGGSSRRSLSLTNTSLQDKKKPSDASNGGPDSARKSFTASRSMLFIYLLALAFFSVLLCRSQR
ncbi:hypothetical protein TB2_027654 [Malus domestica]